MRERYPGVSFVNEASCYIEEGVIIGFNTVIGPNVSISGKTTIGKNNFIGANTVINNMSIGENNVIKTSYLEDSKIANSNTIGPFAHLRANCQLGDQNSIGNFVEMKNVKMESNNKALHLAYLGDAEFKSDNNVGAGAITANFNSKTKEKSKTLVESGVAIGSNSVLVAPLKLFNKSTVAAGSVITEDVPENSLAIARPRQSNKENY